MSVIADVLAEAERLGCSDVHLAVDLPPTVRLHGTLRRLDEYPVLDETMMAEILSQIAGKKQLETIAQKIDCDFSYISFSGHRYRVNVYRQKGENAIAMRLLRNQIPTFEELMLPEVLADFSMRPRGLVLVTGPTGSGKSTTLAAMINHINRMKNDHIITIEDPIEYLHSHNQSIISQREVGDDVDSFAGALRSALREDPDVILVGEMRDFETIAAAITAAETGHLVMSTLHTTGAASTIDRIIDVFPPYQQQQIRTQLASVLVGIVSQTLVPTTDENGRVAAMEILAMTDAIGSMIREGKIHQIPTAIQTGRNLGMKTLDYDLARLTRMGIISEHHAIQRCHSAVEFRRFLNMS